MNNLSNRHTTLAMVLLALACGDDRRTAGEASERDAEISGDGSPDAATIDASNAQSNRMDGGDTDAANDTSDMSDGQAPSVEAGADANAIPVSLYCGDAIRDPITEECDDGTGDQSDSCTADCRVRNVQAVPLGGGSATEAPGRGLGTAPHVLAANSSGFLMTFVEHELIARVLIQRFDAWGGHVGEPLDASEDFAPTALPNPAIAALPGDRYAIAWTEGGAGSPDIALRSFDAQSERLGPLIPVHQNTAGPQQDPDLLWSGDDLILAWTDLSDVYVRRFDEGFAPRSPETPLETSASSDTSVALAAFGSGFAAGYRALEDGFERVRVRAGAFAWWTEQTAPCTAGDRPALAELDSEHLLLLHSACTPDASDSAGVSRLHVALLSTAQQGLVTSQPLSAIAEPFASDFSLAQRRPRVTRVGTRLYVAWEQETALGTEAGSELLLQELAWSAMEPATLTQVAEHRLLVDAPNAGDQQNPALASSPLIPEGALITAWEDRSGLWPGGPVPDIVLGLRPSPIIALPLAVSAQ